MTFFASSRHCLSQAPGTNKKDLRQHRLTKVTALYVLVSAGALLAQAPVVGKTTPTTPLRAWIDADTGNRIVRLTDEPGSQGLYFDKQAFTPDGLDMIYTSPQGIHDLRLATLKSALLVGGKVGTPIVGTRSRRVFYKNLTDGRYYVIDIDSRLTVQLPPVPPRGRLTSVNADETLLAGTQLEGSSPELTDYRLKGYAAVQPAQEEALRSTKAANAAMSTTVQSLSDSLQMLKSSASNPSVSSPSTTSTGSARSKLDEARNNQTSAASLVADARQKNVSALARFKAADADAARQRFEAREPQKLFTVNIQTGEIKTLLKGNDWLNHVEFSPTDPSLLMYAHEGPALKLDRVWTIRTDGSKNLLMHKREGALGIATHEFWSSDGRTIWFDLQETKGDTFAVAGVSVASGEKTIYHLKKEEASMHYNVSRDGSLFCGDGNFMAHGEIGVNGHRTLDRAWIELLRPYPGGTFHSTRLAHITANRYEVTEPNPRFSPDGKMVIFTSKMLGRNYIFGVELAKAAESKPRTSRCTVTLQLLASHSELHGSCRGPHPLRCPQRRSGGSSVHPGMPPSEDKSRAVSHWRQAGFADLSVSQDCRKGKALGN